MWRLTEHCADACHLIQNSFLTPTNSTLAALSFAHRCRAGVHDEAGQRFFLTACRMQFSHVSYRQVMLTACKMQFSHVYVHSLLTACKIHVCVHRLCSQNACDPSTTYISFRQLCRDRFLWPTACIDSGMSETNCYKTP